MNASARRFTLGYGDTVLHRMIKIVLHHLDTSPEVAWMQVFYALRAADCPRGGASSSSHTSTGMEPLLKPARERASAGFGAEPERSHIFCCLQFKARS